MQVPFFRCLWFLFALPLGVWGQTAPVQLQTLPLPPSVYTEGAKEDWLVEPVELPSRIFRTPDARTLLLSNGLVSRAFRLSPEAATVSFKQLRTQEEWIRAIEPEALVEIGDFLLPVGGMEGQPNRAFLYPDWIDSLKAPKAAFRLQGFSAGAPEARFAWNRVRHHAPNLAWPPKGLHLRMDYTFPDLSPGELLSVSQQSSLGRDALLETRFESLAPSWKLRTSPMDPQSTFAEGGLPGRIRTPKNTAVFAEHPLPPGVGLVVLTLNRDTDLSGAWGPGIALTFPDRVVQLNLKEGSEAGGNRSPFKLMVFDGEKQIDPAGGKTELEFVGEVQLRLRIAGATVLAEVKPQGHPWRLVERIDWGGPVPDPLAVKIGKPGPPGPAKDHDLPGETVRLRLIHFAAYSRLKEERLAQLQPLVDALRAVRVAVHYELYDGIPVMAKWVSLHNNSPDTLLLQQITSESLALADYDPYNGYSGLREWVVRPPIHLETEYAFGAQRQKIAARHSVHWERDPHYVTQINYHLESESLLRVYPDQGYHLSIPPDSSFSSIRSFLMPFDSEDKERQGLALRKMYRSIAPWLTENPLMFHLTRNNWEAFQQAVDQCADIGYEMINFSFGSGFDAEDESRANYARIRRYVDYAREKGITLGTYSLLSSRRISDEDDVVNPATGKPGGFARFGHAPCLGSEWGLDYFRKMYRLFDETGLMTFTHDGSYPGDVCASTSHPGHEGLGDSQYRQWEIIKNFYQWCRAKGVYIRVPDYYYLVGSNHHAIGYRENNWSLPRRHQLIHTRQNIFDGTWESTPTMRWCFIPLQQYHGGGAAATVEPLHEHLDHYELMLVSNLGSGVQAVLRGPRLYDTPETRAMVKRVVDWFKKYRGILESDIIHLRRADARDLDYLLHVNPGLKEKGMLMVFNPTDQAITRTLTLPLYYTGLQSRALIREQEQVAEGFTLSRDYTVQLSVTVPPNGYNWYVIEGEN